MKLFAFYIGGATKTSNIEVHDMRFVIGERMEDCFDSLRQQWWGTTASLHIDCLSELTSADSHRIVLRSESALTDRHLFS